MGARLRAARASLHDERVLAHRGSAYVLAVNHRGWRLLLGADRGRLRFLAAVSTRLSTKRLGGLLVASGS